MPLSAYPERVQKEFELCVSPPRGNRFAQHGHQKRLQPATVTQNKVLIELALSAAVEAGTDPASITTLDYLFEPLAFQTILERYCEDDADQTPRPTAHNLARMLIGFAKQRLGSSPTALDRIAELHRLRGEISDAPGGWSERALEIARSQAGKSLELRVTVSLARLWRQRGASDQARRLLTPVYEWVTEGLETADLIEARTLLAQL